MNHNSDFKCPSNEYPVCEFNHYKETALEALFILNVLWNIKLFFSHFSQINLNLLIIKVLNASRIFCFPKKNIVCVNRQNFRVKEEKKISKMCYP